MNRLLFRLAERLDARLERIGERIAGRLLLLRLFHVDLLPLGLALDQVQHAQSVLVVVLRGVELIFQRADQLLRKLEFL